MRDKHTKSGKETENEADIDVRLGKKIREAYSDILDAPLPDRFLKLLNQLEEADKGEKVARKNGSIRKPQE